MRRYIVPASFNEHRIYPGVTSIESDERRSCIWFAYTGHRCVTNRLRHLTKFTGAYGIQSAEKLAKLRIMAAPCYHDPLQYVHLSNAHICLTHLQASPAFLES